MRARRGGRLQARPPPSRAAHAPDPGEGAMYGPQARGRSCRWLRSSSSFLVENAPDGLFVVEVDSGTQVLGRPLKRWKLRYWLLRREGSCQELRDELTECRLLAPLSLLQLPENRGVDVDRRPRHASDVTNSRIRCHYRHLPSARQTVARSSGQSGAFWRAGSTKRVSCQRGNGRSRRRALDCMSHELAHRRRLSGGEHLRLGDDLLVELDGQIPLHDHRAYGPTRNPPSTGRVRLFEPCRMLP